MCGFLPAAEEPAGRTGRKSATLTSIDPGSYSITFVTVSTSSLTSVTTTPIASVLWGLKYFVMMVLEPSGVNFVKVCPCGR